MQCEIAMAKQPTTCDHQYQLLRAGLACHAQSVQRALCRVHGREFAMFLSLTARSQYSVPIRVRVSMAVWHSYSISLCSMYFRGSHEHRKTSDSEFTDHQYM